MSELPRAWPRPPEEAERLAALRGLALLDKDEELDALTRLAAYICGTSAAELNLIEEDRQLQLSAFGHPPSQLSRDDSLCGYSILSRDVTYTADASHHPALADNPHVTGEKASVRMYVAAPLIVADGHVVGSLCAYSMDSTPLTRVQIERLRDLARAAVRILELRQAAGALARQATHDPLTGLPNRTLLSESLTRALARRERAITEPGLLFIDLDGFKQVNDRFGHGVGDTVLREVADRLLGCVRATDLVARLGGDEFVVLVEAATEGDDLGLELLAQRVRDAVSSPLSLLDGTPVRLSASVGVAVAEHGSDTPALLLERADAAMYRQKSRV